MGYKLAGYDVVAANDIDPRMKQVYVANNKVKKFYLCPVKDLLARDDLPEVDILDVSPPCSTFSMSGGREKDWGRKKKFREGQAEQVLSDLFFDFIALAEKMKPPVVVAENVKGMLLGNAKGYTKAVVRELERIGYSVQVFLLNAATMGCPTNRERVFFVGNRLGKKIALNFDEPPILYGEFASSDFRKIKDGTKSLRLWQKRKFGDRSLEDVCLRGTGKQSFFNWRLLYRNEVMPTIVARNNLIRFDDPGRPSEKDIITAQTFPQDYDFCGQNVDYVVGMSVPPVMMAQISSEIAKQIFDIKEEEC